MMERKRATHMNLSVKIKKEEEDPVLYISCNNQEPRHTRSCGRQYDGQEHQSYEDGIHNVRRKASIRIIKDSIKDRECRHRWTRSVEPKSQEINKGRNSSEVAYQCVDSKCYSGPVCFKELSAEHSSWSSEQTNGDWQTEKRFKCEFCKSKFTRRSSLNRHMECIHRDTKMYACDICLDQFPGQSARDRHRDLHVKGGKMYQCTTCDKAFQYPEMLVRHANWHRKEEGKLQHRCFVCELSFNKASSLATHMEQCHNMKSAPISTVLERGCIGGTDVDRWRRNTCSVPQISKVYSIVSRSDEKDTFEEHGFLNAAVTKSENDSHLSSSQSGYGYTNHASSRPKMTVAQAQVDERRNRPMMAGGGSNSVCHQNGRVVCTSGECAKMPMDPANRDLSNGVTRKVMTPVSFVNGAPSEVRTKSSVKRKLLHSLASRREVALANAKRRALGSGIGQPTGVNMQTYHDTKPFCNTKNQLYVHENNTGSYEFNGRKAAPVVGKRDSFNNGDGKLFSNHRDYDRISPKNNKPPTVNNSADTPKVFVRVPLSSAIRPSPPRERHEDVRDYDEVYECPKCGKDYQACRYMETHLLLHDDVTDLPCHFCVKKFISKKDLEKHIHTRHTPRQRLQKKGTSMINKTLKADVEQINRVLNSTKNAQAETNERPPSSNVCKEPDVTPILEHDTEAADDRGHECDGNDNVTENPVILPPLSRNFKCGFCTLRFAIASELEEHICAHLMSKPFRCALCTESFSSIYNLEQHLQDHKEPETFEADEAECATESTQTDLVEKLSSKEGTASNE